MTTEQPCKLLNTDLSAFGGYEWDVGTWHTARGSGGLCSAAWLHSYRHPLLAVQDIE